MYDIDEKTIKELIKKALEAREKAYVPYSNFQVGAALLSDKDKIFKGCNIENASYGLSNCAERTAFFKAVSKGVTSFKAVAITGGPKGADKLELCPPCGACRQVMTEFCDKDFLVILACSEDDYKVYTLEEMLPHSFSL